MPSQGMMALSCGGAGSFPAIHWVAHSAETPLMPMLPVHQACSPSQAIVSHQRDSGPGEFSGLEPEAPSPARSTRTTA